MNESTKMATAPANGFVSDLPATSQTQTPIAIVAAGSTIRPSVRGKSNHGYIGFIEELPGVNSHGRTLDEARETLQKLAAVVFDEERREAEELIAGKDVVRESFFVPIPRPA